MTSSGNISADRRWQDNRLPFRPGRHLPITLGLSRRPASSSSRGTSGATAPCRSLPPKPEPPSSRRGQAPTTPHSKAGHSSTCQASSTVSSNELPRLPSAGTRHREILTQKLYRLKPEVDIYGQPGFPAERQSQTACGQRPQAADASDEGLVRGQTAPVKDEGKLVTPNPKILAGGHSPLRGRSLKGCSTPTNPAAFEISRGRVRRPRSRWARPRCPTQGRSKAATGDHPRPDQA